MFAMGTAPAVIFTLFWLHVIIHGPASASCHLIGNAGISKYWYDLTLQADYQCIFIASTLLSITLSYWVFPIEGTLAISLLAIAMTVHLVSPPSTTHDYDSVEHEFISDMRHCLVSP